MLQYLMNGWAEKLFLPNPNRLSDPESVLLACRPEARCFVAVVADYVRTRQHTGCRQADRNGRKES